MPRKGGKFVACVWLAGIASVGAASAVQARPLRVKLHVSQGSPAARLVPEARLAASSSTGPVEASEVAVGAGVVAAAGIQFGPDGAGPPNFPGAFVYTEPVSGPVQSPAAMLAAPSGSAIDGVRMSGNTVVARTVNSVTFEPSGLVVFTRPMAGWSGVVSSSATLSPTDGARLLSFAVSGTTAVASTFGGGDGYVFAEPTSGWSGVIHESAKLVPSDGAKLASVVVLGSTVAAVGSASDQPARVYIFTEPAGGWAGTIHETARLSPAGDALAITRGLIVTGGDDAPAGRGTDWLFREPEGGWSGSPAPSAVLTFPLSDSDAELFQSVAASPRTVAVVTDYPGADHNCPCNGAIDVFNEPLRGWTGHLRTHAVSAFHTRSGDIALQGHTLVAGATDGAHVFTNVPPPTVGNVALGGLATRQPRLRVNVTAGDGVDPIRSVAIRLPRGLRASERAGTILARGDRYRVRQTDHRAVVVTLRRALTRLRVVLQPPVIMETLPLAAAIRRAVRSHRHLRRHIYLAVTDSRGHTTRFAIRATIA